MELDGKPPFHTIPLGENQVIAFYEYSSQVKPCVADEVAAEAAKQVFNLTFIDGAYGDPKKVNTIVIGGKSVVPEKVNGQLTLMPCISIPEGDITIAAGACSLVTPGVDVPAKPTDEKDPTDPSKYLARPGDIVAEPGDKIQVGFWYKFPPDAILDNLDEMAGPDQIHQIQGMSIAACYDSKYLSCLSTYTLDGTITKDVGAEFINVHSQDKDADEPNRPGELVIGILVDALPPFLGQYLPPSSEFLKLICVDFKVLETAGCDVVTGITFCNGANGAGKVPTNNLASVYNHSWPMTPWAGSASIITLRSHPKFVRGDCNFNSIDHLASTGKDAVDIADAAAIISYLFQTGDYQFQPPCLDACDANDDGRVDLADSVFVLRYMFKFDKKPPEPFEVSPGVDPTPDRLTCEGGHSTCAP
jgi:hypothetical protein